MNYQSMSDSECIRRCNADELLAECETKLETWGDGVTAIEAQDILLTLVKIVRQLNERS